MGNRKLFAWFLGFMAVYFLTRYFRQNFSETPSFFKYQFTDLLFVPTMCFFALLVVRIVKRNKQITISPGLVFLQVGLVALYFEWYLPNYRSHIHPYTCDPWDVLMYIFGGILFLIWQRRFA